MESNKKILCVVRKILREKKKSLYLGSKIYELKICAASYVVDKWMLSCVHKSRERKTLLLGIFFCFFNFLLAYCLMGVEGRLFEEKSYLQMILFKAFNKRKILLLKKFLLNLILSVFPSR